jgi:hypothetical protein
MRSHITRTVIAAVAAGAAAAALALAASAVAHPAGAAASVRARHGNSPTGGSPVYTAPCPIQGPFLTAALGPAPALAACAGYQASGRDFRFAQALITVPTTPCTLAAPEMYIALAGSGSYAQAGIRCGLGLSGPDHRANGPDAIRMYQGFFTILTQGVRVFTRTIPLNTVDPGDGVFFTVYFNQAGNSDQFTATGPGVTVASTARALGPIYTQAYALTDWSLSLPATPVQPTASTRMTQFLQGRFTTASGQRGTFEGPWTLSPVEVTSNGLAAPLGTLVSAPSYLWNDGTSAQGTDAFGVWLYS